MLTYNAVYLERSDENIIKTNGYANIYSKIIAIHVVCFWMKVAVSAAK